MVTMIVASLPRDLWNRISSANGYSLMTSLLRTKKGSPEPSISLSLARARGPAVPSGSVSWEQVILMPSLLSKSFKKLSITCREKRWAGVSGSTETEDDPMKHEKERWGYLWLIIDGQNDFGHSYILQSFDLTTGVAELVRRDSFDLICLAQFALSRLRNFNLS